MKKRSKRWLSILLIMAMLLTMAVPVFAEEPDSSIEQIPIDEVREADIEGVDASSLEDSEIQNSQQVSIEKLKKAVAKVVVVDGTRTVLYEDGTLILNELDSDQENNEAKHGAASKEFPAWDGTENDYAFGDTGVPWFNSRYNIKRVEIGSKISPTDTSKWFFNCTNASSAELSNLDMSNVTSTDGMFYSFGSQTLSVTISGLETWDMSNVKNMHGTFQWVGQNAGNIAILGMEDWNVSNVTDMSEMFDSIGYRAESIMISGLDGWDTRNVTTTQKMFYMLGYEAEAVTISGLENLNLENVKTAVSMFESCASADKCEFALDVSKWNVSKIENMNNMFSCFRMSASKVTFLGFDKWKINNHANLSGMFQMMGMSGTSPTISEYNIGILTVPGGCIVDSMFYAADNVKGTLIINGMPISEYGGDINLAWGTNRTGGALYLAPTNTATLTWAQETVDKYGLSGDQTQGHIYLNDNQVVSRTVLYADGTLIINELLKDQGANEATHDAIKKEYPAWDGAKNDYNINGNGVPWSWLDDITSVEVGSKISPVNTSRWFFGMHASSINVSLLDMSNVIATVEMFGETTVEEIAGLGNWDMSNVKDAHNMFGWLCMGATTPIELIGIENWKFSSGANLKGMFMSSGAVKFQSIIIPEGCDISAMFDNVEEIYGDVVINGIQTCNETEWTGFARNTNPEKGALYLVPDDMGYSQAEDIEGKYGINGSVTQGHVYLRKMLDFTVTESIDMTASMGSTDLDITDLNVNNLGSKTITVSSVQVDDVVNGWMLTANTTDFAALAKDSKKFSFAIGEFDLSKGPYTAGGNISADKQKVFKLTGKTGVVSTAIKRQHIANLIVTVAAV